MRWAWLVMVVAACGRLGFDDLGSDAGPGAPPGSGSGSGAGTGGMPRLVAASDVSLDGAATVTIPLLPAQVGDVLVIGVATYSQSSFVLQISDDAGDSFVSASARAVSVVGASSSEIWYGLLTHKGASRLTLSLSEASGATMWIAEFADLPVTPPLVAIGDAAPGSMVSGPAVATPAANAVVFSVLRLDDGQVSRIHSGNPFMPLGIVDAQDAAYMIAPAAGAYRAEWDANTVAGACGSTAAFLPL